ncbi:hypothetical protein MLD38_039531 [Melastoma candidum]|uniref:Uncharacterized protein n=1 Tax=Melastoma candidum TaxID=119954 RepID=A0ACB9L2C8_9MYRT|nr:hypothetical protein MLD38_039531 [Melastoma candidum]
MALDISPGDGKSGNKVCEGAEGNATGEDGVRIRSVKVNMDGVPIGRKVDLHAHSCYETLARALADMFLQHPNSDKHLRCKISPVADIGVMYAPGMLRS